MFRLNLGQIKRFPHCHLFQDILNKNCYAKMSRFKLTWYGWWFFFWGILYYDLQYKLGMIKPKINSQITYLCSLQIKWRICYCNIQFLFNISINKVANGKYSISKSPKTPILFRWPYSNICENTHPQLSTWLVFLFSLRETS